MPIQSNYVTVVWSSTNRSWNCGGFWGTFPLWTYNCIFLGIIVCSD